MGGFDEAERVRRRLAHRLHDGPIQELTAAQLFLDSAIMRLDGAEQDELRGSLDKGVQALRRATAACRALMEQLRPGVEADGELELRLRRLAGELDGAATVEVSVPPGFGQGHTDLALALYRVAEELLDNVRRHAAGALAALELRVEDGQAVLRVSDRGPGLSEGVGGDGFALAGARLDRLGGRLTLAASPEGTTVTATVPLPERPQDARGGP